jgi:hypothetical protein
MKFGWLLGLNRRSERETLDTFPFEAMMHLAEAPNTPTRLDVPFFETESTPLVLPTPRGSYTRPISDASEPDRHKSNLQIVEDLQEAIEALKSDFDALRNQFLSVNESHAASVRNPEPDSVELEPGRSDLQEDVVPQEPSAWKNRPAIRLPNFNPLNLWRSKR